MGFLRKYDFWLQIALLLLAGWFLSIDISRPLVDYDEATYAKVVVDTLHSRNFLTLQKSGQDWFEKPPLYLWLAMGSVGVFGEHEFAFRLPGILASILCCWLVYRIVREQTRDNVAAAMGFLILLFSNLFFFYAREARLDSAVIAAILASLLFFIKARENEKLLFWILPSIAVGFMFKSVIAFLAIPIILLYSLAYRYWDYLTNKYFWQGFALSLLIVLPWHLIETLRAGWAFWSNYVGLQVFQRGVSHLTGTNSPTDYLQLIPSHIPWNLAVAGEFVLLVWAGFSKRLRATISVRDMLVPLGVVAGIFLLFTLAQTHLSPYIMPAIPFFAISIAITFHYLCRLVRGHEEVEVLMYIGAIFMVGIAMWFCYTYRYAMVPEYAFEEKIMGQAYKEAKANAPAPFYMLDWLAAESINYYGDTQMQTLSARKVNGQILKGPIYLVLQPWSASYFSQAAYPDVKVLYVGKGFILIYSEKDLQLPVFRYAD